MILERITKKEVLKVLKLGRLSFYELMKLVPHKTERHANRMLDVISTLDKNHYLNIETVQTGVFEDKETGTKTPVFTTYYWDKELFLKCRGA